MNIIFLDIDGVVCTLRSHFAFDEKLLMEAWDITVCQMIARLCEKYDCKIVVTSVWRKNRQCKMYLGIFSLIHYLYGSKERSNSSDPENTEWKTEVLDGIRGDEVKEWLDRHPEIDKYIILDDDSDFLEEQKPFLIQTDGYDGFSARNYIAADKILKGKEDGDKEEVALI